MKHEENTRIYIADEGKTIARVNDGFVMGTCIDLGDNDTIDNYTEVELTEENDIEGKLKENENEYVKHSRLHAPRKIS